MPKSILITGCSSGIGLHAAHTLKNRGYRVFASARKISDVENLKAQGFESVQLDVTNRAMMEKALAEILAKTGGTLDALFNNAGFMLPGAIEDVSIELIREQFETNAFGPIQLTQMVLPVMRKQGHGRIIQNSSVLGIVTVPYYGAYNASKYALEGFSSTLRQELKDTNIKVSIINPGPVSSKLRNNSYEFYKQTLALSSSNVFAEAYKKMEKNFFGKDSSDKLTEKPDVVAKKLIHALESKNPKTHYYPGFLAKMMACFKRTLPDKTIDWLVTRTR